MKTFKTLLMAMLTIALLNFSTPANAGMRDFCVKEPTTGYTVCYRCNQAGACRVYKRYVTKGKG